MASLSSLFLGGGGAFFLLATTVSMYTHIYQTSGNADDIGAATTHLHFYMHDDYTGPRPTAMRVVSGRSLLPPASSSSDDDDGDTPPPPPPPPPSSSSSSRRRRQFGDIVVLNNALTEGPSVDSARVGTAQGFGVRVSVGGVVSHVTMHLVMEAGEHRGSSVAVSCRIDVEEKVRESVVVGGTGRFRFARGYLLTSNYDYDLGRGGVVEFDVYLLPN